MNKVIEKEPIGEVQASIVKAESDPAVLLLGELLLTHRGLRNEVLYRHRFDSPKLRDQFFDWFGRNSNNSSVENLLEIGVKNGTSKLSELLNDLAMSPGGTRSDRKVRRTRRAARAA